MKVEIVMLSELKSRWGRGVRDQGYDLYITVPASSPLLPHNLLKLSHHKTAHSAKALLDKKKWAYEFFKIIRCSDGEEVPIDCIGAGQSFSTK